VDLTMKIEMHVFDFLGSVTLSGLHPASSTKNFRQGHPIVVSGVPDRIRSATPQRKLTISLWFIADSQSPVTDGTHVVDSLGQDGPAGKPNC
jgi:hypothetical protein